MVVLFLRRAWLCSCQLYGRFLWELRSNHALLFKSSRMYHHHNQPFRCSGLWPSRVLYPWNFPGNSTGVVCHFLLQGIFPMKRLNSHLLCLLHWQADSLPPHHLGSPIMPSILFKEDLNREG